MTRQEQLRYCKTCLKRHFDPRRGIVCTLTDEKAAFDAACPNYDRDEAVQLAQDTSSNQERKRTKVHKPVSITPKVKEKITKDDLYLILGFSLINTFLVRLAFYYTLSSNSAVFNTSLLIFTFLLSSIAIFFRRKNNRGNKLFSDIKFKLIYTSFLVFLLMIYSLFMEEFYAVGERIFVIAFITAMACLLNSCVVKPVSYFIRKKDEKPA